MLLIYTNFATFYKLEPDNANADKEGYVAVPQLTGIRCNVQPATSRPAEMATGMFGKNHILYISNTYSGIREGYRVMVSGLYDGRINRFMTVDGVEDWNYPPLPHYEITLSELQK